MFNQKTAELIRKHPDRLMGLCGLGHNWSDGAEITSMCLKNEGMIGIKLRISDDDSIERLTVSSIFNNVVRSIRKNRNKIRMILIHMPGNYPWVAANPTLHSAEVRNNEYSKDVKEIEKLIELGHLFPEIQFVVAHSQSSYELVDELSKRLKLRNLRNFWLETSTALTTLDSDRYKPIDEKDSWRKYAESWKRFGIDRVLFGSDQIIGERGVFENDYDSGERFKNEVSSILNSPFLRLDEKDSILGYNSENFFNIVCDKCRPDFLEVKKSQKAEIAKRNFDTTVLFESNGQCKNFYECSCQGTNSTSDGLVIPMAKVLSNNMLFSELQQEIDSYFVEWIRNPIRGQNKIDYVISEYVKNHKLNEKLSHWISVLRLVREDAYQIFSGKIGQEQMARLSSRLEKITVANDFLENPELLFDITAHSGQDILVGGLLAESNTSFAAIYSTLAHEVAHKLSELGSEYFGSTKRCIQESMSEELVLPGIVVSQEEVWADTFARESLAIRMQKLTWDDETKSKGLRNTLRTFCGYLGSKSGHPSGRWRIESLMDHPVLNQIVNSIGPTMPKPNLNQCAITRS
ncbi:MAG: amidohydrolase family protein [Bdellovibrionales bacterium]|nr:amidohydrolase family protein [Bdellovibrionales bacterium]